MRLIILGAGGYGQTVADIASQTGKYNEILFLDDNQPEASLYPIAGPCSDYSLYKTGDTSMYPAFGNNESRVGWINRFLDEGIRVATIIHPLAYVSPTAVIAEGCVVMPHAVVNTNCKLEKACIMNVCAILDHGCILEEGCHLAPGTIVKAENRLPRCTKVDSGEVIQNRTYNI